MGVGWGGGLIFGRKNTSSYNLLNLLLFFVFSIIKLVFRHIARLARCETCLRLTIKGIHKVNDKVISKRTGTRKVNDIFNNRDTVDVVLVSLLLTLNTFHFLLQCFYCWLWSVICGLGLLLGVLTQKLGKWRNLVNKSHKNTWYV